MVKAKTIGFALISVLSAVLGPSPVHAASDRIHLHQSDFYARAADELYAPHAEAESARPASCYVSHSPADSARGIRYWTGKC